MIDRSYLPFQSARDHQDRGMEKWMGFFLSEHSRSLKNDTNKEILSSSLDSAEKLTLIGQLYISKLMGTFIVKENQGRQTLAGHVTEITSKFITVKSADRHYTVKLQDILAISLEEEQ
ncbi:hypothetical protein AB3331_01615 [Streptococcus sp. H49]|uniref:hypothetical protein n=1 Tax=Streptococcus huangxiaojuni TaxID=3237239 RepID=UPI0034A51546